MLQDIISSYEKNKKNYSSINQAIIAVLKEICSKRDMVLFPPEPTSFFRRLSKTEIHRRAYHDDYIHLENLINRLNTTYEYNDLITILNTYLPLCVLSEVKEILTYFINDIQKMEQDARPLFAMENLCQKKGLNLEGMLEDPIKLDDDLITHAKWSFKHIYAIPYPGSEPSNIARLLHSGPHVFTAALEGLMWANIFRKFNFAKAFHLAKEDVKLIQIATLFHDSARENDGEDKWDFESGEMLYFYLTEKLNVDHAKAKMLAEAVANKDSIDGIYFNLTVNNGHYHWNRQANIQDKNIYQIIIQCSDCLDIVRCAAFDPKYLDFYKIIAKNSHDATEWMSQLIIEARRFANRLGLTYQRVNLDVRAQYENLDAFTNIVNLLESGEFPWMQALYANGQLLSKEDLDKLELPKRLPFDRDKELDDKNLEAAFYEGQIFIRGLGAPSAIFDYTLVGNFNKSTVETCAGLEFLKMARRIETHEKEGNPLRSITMAYPGVLPFASAGFGIIKLNPKAISHVGSSDTDTGRFKKKGFFHQMQYQSPAEKENALRELIQKVQTGNTLREFHGFVCSHPEICYTLTEAQFIYFSDDPNLFNTYSLDKPLATHPHSPLLQAIFIQNEYEKKFGIKLPILEYSGVDGKIRNLPKSAYTEEKIVEMWVAICSSYIHQAIEDDKFESIFKYTPDELKVLSMYRSRDYKFAKENGPADSNYTQELKNKIDDAIEMEVARIKSDLLNRIRQVADSDRVFTTNHFAVLMADQTLLTSLTPTMEQSIRASKAKILSDFQSTGQFSDFVKSDQDLKRLMEDRKNYLMHLPESSQTEKSILYCYEYCKRLGLKDLQNEFNKKANSILQNKVKEMSASVSKYKELFSAHHEISQVIAFAFFFDVYKENKKLIQKMIDNVMSQHAKLAVKPNVDNYQAGNICINSFLTNYYLVTYKNLLALLKTINIQFDIHHKQGLNVVKTIESCIWDHPNKFNFCYLSYFIHLCNTLDTAQDGIEDVLIHWLGHYPVKAGEDLEAFLDSCPDDTFLNNVALFELFFNSLHKAIKINSKIKSDLTQLLKDNLDTKCVNNIFQHRSDIKDFLMTTAAISQTISVLKSKQKADFNANQLEVISTKLEDHSQSQIDAIDQVTKYFPILKFEMLILTMQSWIDLHLPIAMPACLIDAVIAAHQSLSTETQINKKDLITEMKVKYKIDKWEQYKAHLSISRTPIFVEERKRTQLIESTKYSFVLSHSSYMDETAKIGRYLLDQLNCSHDITEPYNHIVFGLSVLILTVSYDSYPLSYKELVRECGFPEGYSVSTTVDNSHLIMTIGQKVLNRELPFEESYFTNISRIENALSLKERLKDAMNNKSSIQCRM